MKYKVKLKWDSIRRKSYYVYHLNANNNSISDDEYYVICDSIPLHEDINANKSCYLDAKQRKWIFDEDKYLELIGYQNKHDDIPLDKVHDNIRNIMKRLDDTLLDLNKSVSHLKKANEKITDLK